MKTFKDTATNVFKGAKVVSDMTMLARDLISGGIDLYPSGGTYSAIGPRDWVFRS